jgi:FkbM family methyltransferase
MNADHNISFTITTRGSVSRLDWVHRDCADDKGSILVDEGNEGLLIVRDQDGNEIAAADGWRVQRYLYRGIAARIETLLRGYLGIPGAEIEIKPGDVIINFGANIGEVALGLANMGAKVLAIEPDPKVISALRANAFGRDIEVQACAAWQSDDEITLYLATKHADSSVIDDVGPPVRVMGRKIDTLFQGYAVDLILGDAEGAEPEVLRGARQTLRSTRYVAIRTGDERHGESSAPLCLPILEAAGFEILSTAQETIIGRNKHL